MSVLTKLVQEGAVSSKEAEEIEKEAAQSSTSVEKILLERGISNEQILNAKQGSTELPMRQVEGSIPYEILQYIPEESARYYGIVPLGIADEVLEVGIINPDNIEALDALNFIARKARRPYKLFIISEPDFESVLKMYQGLTGEVTQALSNLESELDVTESEVSEHREQLSGTGDDGVELKELAQEIKSGDKSPVGVSGIIKEDAPVTKIVATIVRYAVEGRASDIHIEPTAKDVRVRFRVDGVLNTSLVLPLKVLSAVVARIKILSSIRLDEKRKPQDGRFSATIEKRRVDFRVSTFPTYNGEKVVMRILDPQKGARPLNELGFSEAHITTIQEALQLPYGMILISGPTGSGKTTTLYSMLELLDRERKNVVSLEDPVEYNIEGVSQSQVRPEIHYTFATGLRSILRQDPDIIMVGEIRDRETAQLAVQAALTGHLVLSTIHTNNAVGVVPRLVDMGVDPYLIAPTLALAIAQRLARRLCPDAGIPIPIEGTLRTMIDEQFADLPDKHRKSIEFTDTMYKIAPSSTCPNGTRGRLAVCEVLEITDEIEHAILTNPTEEAIREGARRNGMLTMKEDAIIKAMHREIPFEDVNALGGELLLEDTKEEGAPPAKQLEPSAPQEIPISEDVQTENTFEKPASPQPQDDN